VQLRVRPVSSVCRGRMFKSFLGEKADAGKKWLCDSEADEALKRQDYETAITLHERFLEKYPENALALYHLGYAYGQTGDHLKEVAYYERAISHGFKNDFIFYNLGMAYTDLSELEKSVGAYAFFSGVKVKASLSPRWIACLTICSIAFGMRIPDRLIWSSSGSISPL